MIEILAGVAGLMGSAAYLMPAVWRLRCNNALKRKIAKDRALFLTYDDGPSSGVTPNVLDLLQSRGARATFFMLGRSAQQYPEIADRIAREGHDVGCHSDQHLNAWKVTPWRAIADIDAGYDRLVSWVQRDGMFRPPYGKMTALTYWAVRNRGARVWWWTIDSGDTGKTIPSPGKVADALVSQGGGIVLLHDIDRSPERNEFVLQTTASLLDVARKNSIKIKRLSELWT
jgi:peptidoglycan-N-acetylglucosamine deacetylase